MAGFSSGVVPCSRRQLRLDTVLQCGQSFRWHETRPGQWLGVAAGRVWRLMQGDSQIHFQVYGASSETEASPCSGRPEEPAGMETDLHHPSSGTDGNKTSNVSTHRPRGRRARSKTESGDLKHRNTTAQQVTSQPAAQTKTQGRRRRLLSSVKLESGVETEVSSQKHEMTSGPASADAVLSTVKTEPHEVFDTSAASEVKGDKLEVEQDLENESMLFLKDYFQLDVDVISLYQQWSAADPYFGETAADFWGIRILRQDPVENLFSFICSSNNHITRISQMVEKLCAHYGRPIAYVDGKLHHSFPSVSSLAQPGVEEKLRELGFGYRAKFIAKSAQYIMENHGEDWVMSLRQRSYLEARVELMKLCGVGAKVADCVCLMSLDKTEAIPVDTHVWQFAARHYLPKLLAAKNKSLTDKLYQDIGDHFRNLWGDYAGWAQSVMFTAELRHMQNLKTSPVKKEKATEKSTEKRQSHSAEECHVASKQSKSKVSKKK